MEICETLKLTLRGKTHVLTYRSGDTIFETARRAHIRPPASCLKGECGTCMAKITLGTVTMRANDVLTPDEIAAGYVLTCQALPTSRDVAIVYEN